MQIADIFEPVVIRKKMYEWKFAATKNKERHNFAL